MSYLIILSLLLSSVYDTTLEGMGVVFPSWTVRWKLASGKWHQECCQFGVIKSVASKRRWLSLTSRGQWGRVVLLHDSNSKRLRWRNVRRRVGVRHLESDGISAQRFGRAVIVFIVKESYKELNNLTLYGGGLQSPLCRCAEEQLVPWSISYWVKDVTRFSQRLLTRVQPRWSSRFCFLSISCPAVEYGCANVNVMESSSESASVALKNGSKWSKPWQQQLAEFITYNLWKQADAQMSFEINFMTTFPHCSLICMF